MKELGRVSVFRVFIPEVHSLTSLIMRLICEGVHEPLKLNLIRLNLLCLLNQFPSSLLQDVHNHPYQVATEWTVPLDQTGAGWQVQVLGFHHRPDNKHPAAVRLERAWKQQDIFCLLPPVEGPCTEQDHQAEASEDVNLASGCDQPLKMLTSTETAGIWRATDEHCRSPGQPTGYMGPSWSDGDRETACSKCGTHQQKPEPQHPHPRWQN